MKLRLNCLQRCHVCKKPVAVNLVHLECAAESLLDGVLICTKYNRLAKKLIGEIKYSLYQDVVNFIGKLYVQKLHRNFTKTEANSLILVPVPLFKTKRNTRGFNQAELIATYISSQTGIQTINYIQRNRNTRTQVGLSRKERMTNLKEAFALVARERVGPGAKAVIVDDVMTTGTTLEECAALLRQIGFVKVYGLVYARG